MLEFLLIIPASYIAYCLPLLIRVTAFCGGYDYRVTQLCKKYIGGGITPNTQEAIIKKVTTAFTRTWVMCNVVVIALMSAILFWGIWEEARSFGLPTLPVVGLLTGISLSVKTSYWLAQCFYDYIIENMVDGGLENLLR